MISDVLTLFKTLFDIIRLQKGPEAIPHSPVLFALLASAWTAAAAAVTAMIGQLNQSDFAISMLLGIIALVIYAAVIVFSQKSSRVLQSLTAILGCGVLLECLFVTGYLSLTPILGKDVAGLASFLILLWSVPVEGHIIARAIDRHWYVGLLIAIAVFLIQIQVSTSLGSADLATS
ncbi:MAG: hypothetical protein HQ492_00535 [Woeseiaceae bacterium]|nr:hypothetical protein [Woeseiaceae bacterium]